MSILTHAAILAFSLLYVAGAGAASVNNDPPIPKQSTDRFLSNVPAYAGGKPSPNILYSTQAVGEAANSPAASKSGGPSVTSLGAPAPYQPLTGSTLQGGKIEHKNVERSAAPQSTWR